MYIAVLLNIKNEKHITEATRVIRFMHVYYYYFAGICICNMHGYVYVLGMYMSMYVYYASVCICNIHVYYYYACICLCIMHVYVYTLCMYIVMHA